MLVEIDKHRIRVRLTTRQWFVVWTAILACITYIVRTEVEFHITSYRLDQCEKQLGTRTAQSGQSGVSLTGNSNTPER